MRGVLCHHAIYILTINRLYNMKLHLPILLRRAVLAVMAALAVSPAVAHTHVHTNTTYTLTDEALNSDYNAVDGTNEGECTSIKQTGGMLWWKEYEYTHHSHLEMNGKNSNKIVSKDFSFAGYTLPGYVLGGTQPNVKVIGNIEMSTTSGYNAIVGSVTGTVTFDLGWLGKHDVGGGRPNVTAGGDVVMNGPANAVMLGSTINGTNITLNNTGNQTTTIGKVTDGILGDFAKGRIDDSIKGIEGIFNIVQGSKLNADGSVTLSTATDTAVNKLKANIIAGGQGDLSTLVNPLIEEKLGAGSIANTVTSAVNTSIKNNDFGSSITAGTDINLLGGASVIVDTTLSDLLSFGTSKDLAALLAGNENNSTTVTLNAGKNLNLDSIINMAYGAQGGVELSAGTAEGEVGAINATGAFNIIGGKTTLTADKIILEPETAVSINKLVGELSTQLPENLSGSLPINDIKALAGELGDLADQPISANVIAGGSKLTATGTGKEGDITIGGTLGLVMNTPVDKVVDSLMSLDPDGEEPVMTQLGGIAKDLLQAGKATSLTSENGNINVGSQFNLVHGGGFPTTTEAENTNVLTLTANNGAVNIQGTANVVSGNVKVNAKDINLTGVVLSDKDMAKAASGLAGSLVNKIPYGDKIAATGILDKLVNKGSVNMVTGGAMLTATAVENAEGKMVGGDITMTGMSVDDVGKIGNINAVIDTKIENVVDAVIGGNTGSLVHGGGYMTTLKADGNIDMLGRVNVVNGSYVTMEAGKEVNMQGNISMIGGAKVTADSININTSTEDKYKMYLDAKELGALTGETKAADTSAESPLASIGVNGAIIAGGANVTATGKDGIEIGGTAGILVNTKLTDVMDALDTLQAGHQMLFAKEVLASGTATKVEATNGNIMLGSQLNLVHGGNLADENATLTIAANNGTVNLQGTGNVVSGNVKVDANGISMMGERLPDDMAALGGMVGDLAGSVTDSIPGVDGVLDKLVQKGSVNVVTGGATLTAGADGITMSDIPADAVGKTGVINAVLDTQLTDVITAIINGEPSAILPTDRTDVIKATTTLSSGGDIDMLGRVNVVAGLRGNVVVDAVGNVELQGNLSMVAGNASVTGKTININTDDAEKYKMYVDSSELSILPDFAILDKIGGAIEGVAMNAAVVAGGANLTSEGVDDKGNGITIGGTVGLLMNTPVADAIKEFNPLNPGKNASELEIVESLLQKGEATTLTAEKGNILVGSQFNLMHGGNMANDDAALKLSAANGAVNVEGTANVVSGNVKIDAQGISMMGERLPEDMAALGGLVGDVAGGLAGSIPGGKDMLGKLVQKGSVNVVTGGATLTAGADGITMSDIPVDSVGATGAINAVLDTDLAGVLGAMTGDNMMDSVKAALMAGGSHQTTLTSGGSIDMLGRVNVVNGGKVVLDADGDVNLQGNASLISGGAKVDAANININTDDAAKYKLYFDSAELSGLVPAGSPFAALIPDSISDMGINAGIVAGGAELTAKDNITMGGTLGLVMNTPVSEVLARLGSTNEIWEAKELLNTGVATNLTSTEGNITVGAQLNLVHGGNFTEDGANVLALTAEKGAVNVQGSVNVVSGNVEVNANAIKLTGERLPADMASVAGDVVDGVAGLLPGAAGGIAGGMLDKLVQKGAANIVTGGATLTAGTGGITMSGVHETGAINAVLDTELPGVLQAFIERNNQYLIDGGTHQTTLSSDGNIDMLGRVNVVNGGKVVLDADGDVNLQGNASLISGRATVDAKNININTDESADYKMYIDSTDLGGLVSANSPFAPIVDSISNVGVNAGIVAGGAKLTATDNITIGGTLGLVVNTPMSSVMTEVVSYLGHMQETWMVSELLKPGTATTVTAENGNIEVGAQFNLLHGGGFTANAGENALVLSAANGAVNVEGTFNVVSGNTQVTAQEINMMGEILPADMAGAANGVVDSVADRFIGELPEAADNLLDRLVAKGNANMVTGGATLTATGENGITMSGAANAVIDTELTDVFEAFMERTTKPLEEGGNHQTTLTSAGNINMLGRLNVVNGSYVKLDAAQDVNLKGTLNMVSGGAKVYGKNINLVGQQNLGLNWDSLLPGDVGNYMDQMGVTDKLNKGVNGNLVLGGAMIEAKNDISISGMASVVMNTPLGSAFEALTTLRDNSWYPELWLAKDVLDDGIATTLKADGNIEMDSRLNVLHGGNMGNADAALKLTAGKEVNIAGTANIISGNTQVTAGEGIKITGKNSVGFDWNQIADALPDKYDGYGKLAGEMGILDKLSKGVNGSVIAGGATLTATNGDITMEGMATAVVDVTAKNVLEAVETMNGTPIMEGGAEDTTITAKEGNINLNSRLNLVNGGQVTVDAGKNVNMGGTFNVVSGNATVKAGTNIEMNARNKVGVDISPMLKGHYAEIAKEMGMADVLENGVSSNIVAGGADLQAEGDVVMSGVATAIVDTTASNVIGAVKGNDLGELMKGGRSTTEVTAGNDIKLVSQMNVVNGGNGNNASGVVLNAGHDVIMSGDIDVVNRAKVNAGNAVAFNGDKSVVKYSDIYAGKVSFTGKNAEITDVNFYTASVEVIGTALVNTADSEVAINELIVDAGNIENLGSLELKAAALAGATLHNAGSIEVNGAMTLNSATLSFVADSNNVANGGNLTFNSTAITLGAEGFIEGISTFSGNGSTDMIAGVSFLLHYDGIEFIDNTNEFEYNLAIFQGATKDEYNMLVAANAIEMDELTLTLDNGYHIESINSMEVLFSESDGVVYISGTATVPEPTTATLSLLALAALAARRRRQK